jgi:hypothetical protein
MTESTFRQAARFSESGTALPADRHLRPIYVLVKNRVTGLNPFMMSGSK